MKENARKTQGKKKENERKEGDRKEQKEGGVKKIRRGMKAPREIKKYQMNTKLLIRRLPFQRLVKEIMEEMRPVKAVWEAGEAFLIRLLGQANLCAMHVKCITVMPKDIKLARQIRRDI